MQSCLGSASALMKDAFVRDRQMRKAGTPDSTFPPKLRFKRPEGSKHILHKVRGCSC